MVLARVPKGKCNALKHLCRLLWRCSAILRVVSPARSLRLLPQGGTGRKAKARAGPA